MEDLNPYIERAEHYFEIPETPASLVSQLYLSLFPTPEVFIQPIPPSLVKMITRRRCYYGSGSTNRKSFDFMDCLVVAMMESLDWEIHLMEVAYLRLNFFRLLVEFLSWAGDVITVLETEPWKIETGPCQTGTSRDPPKIFIPIPKLVESNGCARSDLNPFAYF